jgi:hypothetical protein|tara:strand:+ start:200 stop:574 length:375 start_codon:yes stop_codon:yes gene_type:complete
MSKVMINDKEIVYNVRDDENKVIPSFFILKTLKTKEYSVLLEKDGQRSIVAPIVKNFSDAMDMIKLMHATNLDKVTEKQLTSIRSERAKRSWAKRKANSTAKDKLVSLKETNVATGETKELINS